jgi:hypothetical protein
MVEIQTIGRAFLTALVLAVMPGCFSSPTPHPAQDAGITTPPDDRDTDVRDPNNGFGEACGADGGSLDGCDPGDGSSDTHGDGGGDTGGEVSADGEAAGEGDAGPEP